MEVSALAKVIGIARTRAHFTRALAAHLMFPVVGLAQSGPGLTQPASIGRYPERSIRLVVPFNAGSATDAVARQVAPKISEYLGQNLVVDNRGGASGTVGATIVAKARADGYTILLGTVPSNAIAPSLDKNLAYDPVKDFVAIARITTSPYMLAVNSALPVNSVKELIVYAKASAGKLNYASTGNGTGTQLAGAFLASKAGVNIKHIPYNVVGQLIADLSTGAIHMIFYPYQGLLPVLQSGKVRLLATTAPTRSAALPDLPTMQEQGLADFTLSAWQGFYAPAGTPRDRVQILYEAIQKAMLNPQVAASVTQAGNNIELANPTEFAAFTKREVERYRQIILSAGAGAPGQ